MYLLDHLGETRRDLTSQISQISQISLIRLIFIVGLSVAVFEKPEAATSVLIFLDLDHASLFYGCPNSPLPTLPRSSLPHLLDHTRIRACFPSKRRLSRISRIIFRPRSHQLPHSNSPTVQHRKRDGGGSLLIR